MQLLTGVTNALNGPEYRKMFPASIRFIARTAVMHTCRKAAITRRPNQLYTVKTVVCISHLNGMYLIRKDFTPLV